MDNIRWKVIDPLGRKIFLSEKNFFTHIVGMHVERDAKAREMIEEQVKYSVKDPRFIVKDKNIEGRQVYLDLVDIVNDDSISIRPLFVVVEASGEIVTWFAKRTINVNVPKDGGIVYDKRLHNL